MQSIILSSGSTRTRNPTPGGIPPFSYRAAPGEDLMTTQSAAQSLADRIAAAWAVEGHSVDAWVVKLPNIPSIDGNGRQASWGVRTDLVNGMPSGFGRIKWERKYGRGI